MKISYSFNLTPQAPASKPKEDLVEYSYNEFFLDLPPHWRQIATSQDRTLNFQSDRERAAIIVSVDFFEVPDEKALGVAEKTQEFRRQALEQVAPGRVEVLKQSVKPHSGGVGLEVSWVAQIPDAIHLYVGYITNRKILNFTMICPPDKFAAAELFNKTMENFRAKLP